MYQAYYKFAHKSGYKNANKWIWTKHCVMHQNIDDEGLTDEDNRALPSQIRPKRNKTRPKYLKDYEEPIKGRRSLWITLPNFNTTRMVLLLYSCPILLVIGW